MTPSTRKTTKEFEAWERLLAVHDLDKAITEKLPLLFLPGPVPIAPCGGIKGRALQALRATPTGEVQRLFVNLLYEAVETAETKAILFFPRYKTCFACVPAGLAIRSLTDRQRPAELRLAVESPLDFGEQLRDDWSFALFGHDQCPKAVVAQRIKPLGVPLGDYMWNDVRFGDKIYEDEADYHLSKLTRRLGRTGAALSFVRLAKVLQVL